MASKRAIDNESGASLLNAASSGKILSAASVSEEGFIFDPTSDGDDDDDGLEYRRSGFDWTRYLPFKRGRMGRRSSKFENEKNLSSRKQRRRRACIRGFLGILVLL